MDNTSTTFFWVALVLFFVLFILLDGDGNRDQDPNLWSHSNYEEVESVYGVSSLGSTSTTIDGPACIGHHSSLDNSSGLYNTAFRSHATNSLGVYNTAFGYRAMYVNNIGEYNAVMFSPERKKP